MPKTPLRALRVPDELWRAAQARARDCGETVSEVVRRGLADYVRRGSADPGAEAATEVATEASPPRRTDGVDALDLQTDSRFLLVQGMIMQRHGLGADEAAAHLRQVAETEGQDLDELVQAVLECRPLGQLGATCRI